MPNLEQVQWEQRTNRPGLEAWHAPQGNHAPRNTKSYLGYVGKKLLTEWEALSPDERRAVVVAWVAERRREKGIT